MARRYSIARRLRWPPPGGRTRVFIEDSDPSRYALTARALADAGYEVGPFCGGRHFHEEIFGEDAPGCPLIEHGGCTLIEKADMIVYRFGLESPENRSVLEKISSTYPQKPIFVEATQAQSEEFRDLLSDHEVVVGPVTVEALVGAVDSLRGKSRRTGASAP